METLLGAIRETRQQLARRGANLARETRDRGVDALGKVRSGALDWRRTVAAHKAGLGEQTPWFRFAGLQVRVLERVDRVLARLSDRMRDEMKRLRRLELPRTTQPAAEAKPTRRATPKKRKAAKEPAAPKRLVLPIADYESLSAKAILGELPRLTDSQCETIRAHERASKKRKTVLSALDARLAS